MILNVEIFASVEAYENGDDALHEYRFNLDEPVQRRNFAENIRNAYNAGQAVFTYPNRKPK